ncbi:ATP-binding cassette domain-containing protein [Bacillaceae bacterium IKA-2]|jgi:ABC-type lipoprotein export system ATPase subunit|nr:ATP-binding cassette domain-containing protein [Bacillaceae bacterium IKA-2]
MYAISANNISKKYISGNQKIILFNDLSLNVNEGEIISISGQYGSGRTTLLKMIAAMTPPNHGTIEVFGKDILTIKRRSDWRLKHIGFLTNKESLIPYFTTKQHLLMGQNDDDLDFEFFNEEAQYILTMLGIDENKLTQYPDQLAKMDRLKITVARVLMTNPRLLLIDELATDLSAEERFSLYSSLVEFAHKQNITIISTENYNDCFFDRMYTLKDGKLIEVGKQKQQILH